VQRRVGSPLEVFPTHQPAGEALIRQAVCQCVADCLHPLGERRGRVTRSWSWGCAGYFQHHGGNLPNYPFPLNINDLRLFFSPQGRSLGRRGSCRQSTPLAIVSQLAGARLARPATACSPSEDQVQKGVMEADNGVILPQNYANTGSRLPNSGEAVLGPIRAQTRPEAV
jgi:hypothetical protein